MIAVAWVLVLIVLTKLFGRWEETSSSAPWPDSGLSSNELVIGQDRAGHYQVNGLINGFQVTFLIDTGATDVVIPGPLAASMGLPRGATSRSQTAGGLVASWNTRLDELRLGNIVLRQVRATVIPGSGMRQALLGMSALKQLELEQKDHWLRLRQK